jgi:serine/threonine-protein kinase
MGVVYAAEHLRLQRKVALKVLAPELAADQRFRDRFIRESQIAASLNHPHIVAIHDAGEVDGDLYLAMQHVEGADLRSLIDQQGALEPERAADIISKVASALDAAHARGLVHRDVKPANILVAEGDHPYLTDFGLTKRPQSVSGLTKTGQFLGSVEYAAPEQFEGKPLDARTDVYSLGCVLYECLTGDVPFPRDQEAAVMYAHLRDRPPKATAKRPELPARIDDVIAKAMAKRPEDRFSSCGDLAEAARMALVPDIGTVATADRDARRVSRRLIVAVAAIIALAGIGAGVWAATRESPSPPPPSPGGPGPVREGVVRVDAASGSVVASVAIPLARTVAADERFAWVLTKDELVKVNASTNAIVSTISPALPGDAVCQIAGCVSGVAVGGERVWIADSRPSPFAVPRDFLGRVGEVDPSANRTVRTVEIPYASAVVFGFGSVWVTDPADGLVFRLDPKDGRAIAEIPAESGGTPYALTAGEGAVWVVSGSSGLITRIDPSNNQAAAPIPGDNASGVAAGEGGVWVSNGSGGDVTQYTSTGDRVVRVVHLKGRADALALGAGALWVADGENRVVWKVDPGSGEVLRRIQLEASPYVVAVAGNDVWVTLFAAAAQQATG